MYCVVQAGKPYGHGIRLAGRPASSPWVFFHRLCARGRARHHEHNLSDGPCVKVRREGCWCSYGVVPGTFRAKVGLVAEDATLHHLVARADRDLSLSCPLSGRTGLTFSFATAFPEEGEFDFLVGRGGKGGEAGAPPRLSFSALAVAFRASLEEASNTSGWLVHVLAPPTRGVWYDQKRCSSGPAGDRPCRSCSL